MIINRIKKACLRRQGYTLVELVVYVTILGITFVIVVGSIVSVYQSFASGRVERKLILAGDIVLETITRDIRAAASIDIGGSTFGSHPGVLDLGAESFSLSGTVLRKSETGSDDIDFTASDVRVTNLVFYRSATSTVDGDRELVKMELGIEAGAGKFLKTKNFFGSALLRGGY